MARIQVSLIKDGPHRGIALLLDGEVSSTMDADFARLMSTALLKLADEVDMTHAANENALN